MAATLLDVRDAGSVAAPSTRPAESASPGTRTADVAAAVAYLVSPESRHVTLAGVVVDDGSMLT